MYEPYPTSGPAQEYQQIQAPRSVRNTVKLMYAGGGSGGARRDLPFR
jgi:hypothetical protein